jgi:hypothetical protein
MSERLSRLGTVRRALADHPLLEIVSDLGDDRETPEGCVTQRNIIRLAPSTSMPPVLTVGELNRLMADFAGLAGLQLHGGYWMSVNRLHLPDCEFDEIFAHERGNRIPLFEDALTPGVREAATSYERELLRRCYLILFPNRKLAVDDAERGHCYSPHEVQWQGMVQYAPDFLLPNGKRVGGDLPARTRRERLGRAWEALVHFFLPTD